MTGQLAERATRRGSRPALPASIRRGCAPNPRRPLAGTPALRAAPAEARCARLTESAPFLRRRLLVLGLAAAAGVAAAVSGAGPVVVAGQEQVSAAPEWPGWGGPRRNFTSDVVGLADSWPDGGPSRLWSRPLGGGHSSILVDRGRLFTQYRPTDGSEPYAWRVEVVVVALDAATGRTLWEHRYPAPLAGLDVPLGVGPHATPLIVGERLFATGTNKQLLALDKATGRCSGRTTSSGTSAHRRTTGSCRASPATVAACWPTGT